LIPAIDSLRSLKNLESLPYRAQRGKGQKRPLYAVNPHSLVLVLSKADPTWRVGVVITEIPPLFKHAMALKDRSVLS
jgi:hypothetical protein